MKNLYSLILCFSVLCLNAQVVEDDFEGNGTITTWYGDDCGIDTDYPNPNQQDINLSNTVLQYNDSGGQYANIQFDTASNFDLTIKNSFKLKLYIPYNAVTGSQTNQISLKLQDGTLAQPWTTQSEIIKPIVLNQWQEIVFNFETDNYINLDSGSSAPIGRTDFNRVVIQINGENNNDQVLAYLDDVLYFDEVSNDPVYDNLVWSDEFDGNGAIDGSKWFHQTQIPNGNSWYNGEIQHYTDRVDNASINGGFLDLVAKKEAYTNQGVTKQYTSARLNSKFAFTYGKIEIRAKLPSGVGTWPAIWMLGKNITEPGAYWQTQGFGTTGWPACGEIDIMEHWGDNQNFVQSAMHTPSSSGNTSNKGGQTISTASSSFHIYTLIWSPEKMIFSVDDNVHYTYNPEVRNANTWPFDQDQYLLFNVAILPNIDPSFTQSSLEVDYVRVYQESPLSIDGVVPTETISFYPNPVSDILHIAFQQIVDENILIKIRDVSGRLISQNSNTVENGKTIFNTSSLSSGIYFINLTFENGTSDIFKFIKQ
ncbi:beta-glucanase precursor [Flavobacteriales bacterium ALC-1]|nr:beta-glucanase precursor [Flavobacteriales bacterium ALC-1]